MSAFQGSECALLKLSLTLAASDRFAVGTLTRQPIRLARHYQSPDKARSKARTNKKNMIDSMMLLLDARIDDAEDISFSGASQVNIPVKGFGHLLGEYAMVRYRPNAMICIPSGLKAIAA